MKTSLHIGAVLALVVVLAPNVGADEVSVTGSVASIESAFQIGDTVTVDLAVSADGEVGVFGVDLELGVASTDLRIRSVTFAEAFQQERTRRGDPLPASRFRAVRTQPARTADRSLGAHDDSVYFATVEVEILDDTGFESALLVQARGIFLGDVPDNTVVFGNRSERHGSGRGRVEIVNLNPRNRDQSDVVFELREIGHDEPAEILSADRTYEVHYSTDCEELNGFALYAIARPADNGIAYAAAPSSGPWAHTDRFEFFDLEAEGVEPQPAPGYPRGYLRCQHANTNLRLDGDRRAGSTGYLCSITTGDPGELILEVMVWFLTDEGLIQADRSIRYQIR